MRKPKLRQEVAKELLYEYYQETATRRRELAALKLFCQELSGEALDIRNYLFRILRYEANYALIGSVLKTLPEEKRRFIETKYSGKRNMTIYGFAMEFHVSFQQLDNWNQNVLTEIADALQYKLKRSDVYNRNKIICMSQVLAMMLSAAKTLDPDAEIFGKYQRIAYESYYLNYLTILRTLDEYIYHPKKGKIYQVVAMIALHPELSKEEIAERCHCQAGTISRYMHLYEKQMMPYLPT